MFVGGQTKNKPHLYILLHIAYYHTYYHTRYLLAYNSVLPSHCSPGVVVVHEVGADILEAKHSPWVPHGVEWDEYIAPAPFPWNKFMCVWILPVHLPHELDRILVTQHVMEYAACQRYLLHSFRMHFKSPEKTLEPKKKKMRACV